MFCGLSWPWLPNRPSNRSRPLRGPLARGTPGGSNRSRCFLAHDKVLFYHHDLGGFVRNRRDLSITLVMGYGLSWWTHSAKPSPAERDWIERLCRLQAAIGPRCAGRALDDFEYLAPRVIRSRWGDLEIVANLSSEPWPRRVGRDDRARGLPRQVAGHGGGDLPAVRKPAGPAQTRWTIRIGGARSGPRARKARIANRSRARRSVPTSRDETPMKS